MININFVFDKIENGDPVENIVPCKTQYEETWSYFNPWFGENYLIKDIIKYNNDIDLKYNINFITTKDLVNKNYRGYKNFYIIRLPDELFFSMWPVAYIPRSIVNEINNGNVTLIIANFFGHPLFVPELITCKLTLRNLKEHLYLNKIHNLNYVKIWIGCEQDTMASWSVGITQEFAVDRTSHQYGAEFGPTNFIGLPEVLGVNIYEKCIIPWLQDIDVNPINEYVEHKDKSHVFLFMNRSPRFHRYLMFKILEQLKTLDYALYSSVSYSMNDSAVLSVMPEYIDYLEQLKISSNVKFNELHDYLINNPNMPDRELPNDDLKDFTGIVVSQSLQNFKNTYFSVITETGTLSEKTFKTIFYGHPFIIVGYPGRLAALKSLGYKTFDCVFDESYDQMDYCGIEKYMCIAEQIQYFCTDEGKQKFIDKMPEIEEVIRHNRNLFLTKDHYEIWAKL